MSLLTVDVGGANQTAIPFAKAGHAEPRQVGKRRYAFAGNERSMIRSEPFIIPLIGDNMPAATVATLRSLFALGAQVLCEGDVFNNGNVSVLCSGELSDEMEVGGTYWIPTLTLMQVTAGTGGILGTSTAAAGQATTSARTTGKQATTILVTSVGTARLALSIVRLVSVSATGRATTSAKTVAQPLTALAAGNATTSAKTQRQPITVAAAGRTTTTAHTQRQPATLATAAGRATVTITGSKIP